MAEECRIDISYTCSYMFRGAGREKELQQVLEVQRGERETVERELAGARVKIEDLTSQSQALEARLSQAESEGRGHTGQVLKWINQIAALQKEAEQYQQHVAALEESLTREKVRASLTHMSQWVTAHHAKLIWSQPR